jgi:protein TonB
MAVMRHRMTAFWQISNPPETDLSETSSLVRTASAYYELPRVVRRPFWQTGLFLLAVAGLHLLGLLLAFGVAMAPQAPESLPVLTVRVLEPVAVAPMIAEATRVDPPARVARARATPTARPQRKVSPRPVSPTPVLTAVATAPAASSFAGAPAAAAAATSSEHSPSMAPAPLVGARYDADYLHNPKPSYPAASRRLGEQGRVVLRVRVSAQGLPLAVEVKQSSGFSRLDAAARAAVERWRFIPARQGSDSVDSSVLVPLQFALET